MKLRGQCRWIETMKVLDLINERTELVQEIGKVKEKQGVNDMTLSENVKCLIS